ncbi:carbohydrate porin [Methylobacterium iners]|uniref:carbohydrate porin n=1 Tax=Methylobacterium iners TaxID=418707 RepID=UPI0024B4EA25
MRSHEATLKLSYQAQIVPGWLVQPDFGYIFNPSGGVVNPSRPQEKIKSGAVFGIRSTIFY